MNWPLIRHVPPSLTVSSAGECPALRLVYSYMARGAPVKKCAWSCWLSPSLQPEPSSRAERDKLSASGGNHTIGPPRIAGICGGPLIVRQLSSAAKPRIMNRGDGNYLHVGVGRLAAAGTAEPARIDPAALSARIAGMMMVRLMSMIPPWRLQRSAACCMTPAARDGTSESTWS